MQNNRRKQKRQRRKKTKNHYFTIVHEEAIIKYARSDSREEKTELYEKLIMPAFDELVDKIVFTYKFINLPNIDYLREDCKIWLTTILDKYDPNRGSKAFSYFSVITKNWFIHKVKQNSKKARREIPFDEFANVMGPENAGVVVYNNYERSREKEEFWERLLKFTKGLLDDTGINKNANDRRVILAVYEIIREPSEIEILNKKAIYLYLREITGLNTKQIAVTLKKIRTRYALFVCDWNNGKL
jgi:hypothetical protein